MRKKSLLIGSFVAAIGLLSCLGVSMAGNLKEGSDVKTLTNATEVYAQIGEGYNGGERGPIMISEATLDNAGQQTDVYCVFLSGTEFVSGQATGIFTDLQVGFEQNNEYTKNAIAAITSTVPDNANMIITGHSLGGMIAQQLSGNATIKNKYNILNVVTFGSPLINPIGREGTVKRLGDTADIVPYLSASGAVLSVWQVGGLNRENGGYKNPLDAHINSYKRADLWGKYDVLGFKDGSAKLTYDHSQVKYFECPSKIFPKK